MTIIITKTKLALGILAMVLVGATVAAASDGVFDDNPSGTYYHDPVEWAYDNGITTARRPRRSRLWTRSREART